VQKFSILLILLLSFGVSSLGHAVDVFEGKQLYSRHCMGCHGVSGEGNMPGLPNFAQGEQLFKSDSELQDSVRNGNGVMPSFIGLLTDDEISSVVAYLRTLL